MFAYAESLEPVIREIGARFEKNNPSVLIVHRPAPDLDLLRQLETGEAPDLVATADGRLLGRIVIPEDAGGYVLLGGDEIVLAAANPGLWSTPREQEQWRQDWINLVLHGSYRFAFADANRDSLGYYTKLVWKLSEIHYDRQGVYQGFLLRMNATRLRSGPAGLVEALRGQEADLAFLYRSTAIQNDFKYIQLPPEVSLGSSSRAFEYSRVFESIDGPGPGVTTQVVGRPIRYAFARLRQAGPWPQLFLDSLTSEESLDLFRVLGYANDPVERVGSNSGFDIAR